MALARADKGGNRGKNFGHGKMGTAHSGFSAGHIAKGHKKLGTIPMKESGKLKK